MKLEYENASPTSSPGAMATSYSSILNTSAVDFDCAADAPPHSGLSPIAVFRHYCSRHLICIVPLFHAEALRTPARASLRDSPSARGIPTGIAPLPRYYDLIRLLHSLSLIAVLPSSLAELFELVRRCWFHAYRDADHAEVI